MVCVRFLGCGGSERVVQRWNSPYLEIHSSEGALHKSKNSLALDDLRFSKKWHYLPDGTELYTKVVYYCIYWRSKTCWFTAWENGKQTKNSGPIIFFFFRESRLPLIQISSGLYQKTARRPQTQVSEMALRKWNTNFRLEHSVRNLKLWLYIFRYSVAPGSFRQVMTQKVVFHFLPNQIFGKRFVNSKQPVLSFSGWDLYVVNF